MVNVLYGAQFPPVDNVESLYDELRSTLRAKLTQLKDPSGIVDNRSANIDKLRDAVFDSLAKYKLPSGDRISAGTLRSMGFCIDEAVPDCATVPVEAVDLSNFYISGDALAYTVTIKEPFKWIECEFVLGKPER